jgi:hypothetical protein
VFAIILGMLVVLLVAGWVIYLAARQPVRDGAHVLAPDGERLTRGARRKARSAAARARAVARRDGDPGAGDPGAADPAHAEPYLEPGDGPSQRVEAGLAARSEWAAQHPPRQQGSPAATPAGGVSESGEVSETISR